MQLLQLERLNTFTALGFRFWDPVRDEQIRDGLVVTARPGTEPAPVLSAFRTGSGVYAFQDLPGLRAYEYPVGEEVPAASPPEAFPITVTVEDRQQRFMPVVVGVDLPLPYRGVYRPAGFKSPPESETSFYLVSAPTRTVPAGVAAIRADLVQKGTGEPAAYAVLIAEVAGEEWYAVADDRGRVAALFPYPDFLTKVGTSPPQILPFTQQQWPVTLRVRYQDADADPLEFPLGKEMPPEFHSLSRQPAGEFWPTEDGPPAGAWARTLTYGQELILETEQSEDDRTLWVTPGP